MTFMHKLSAWLARMWPQGLAFLLPQLPQVVDSRHFVEGTCLALLVALWRALAIKGLSLESGDLRRCRHVTLLNGRRMRDRHPCRDFRVPGTRWRVRVALLIVHKIP
jgi:hypothetical protein